MKAGFTGTRKGMSQRQLENFVKVMSWLQPTELHHGGADGADTEAAEQADRLLNRPRIVVHRPKRMTSDDLLARNRDIVAAVDVLVAVPECDREQQRSGTWATVRYARAKGIPVVLLPRGGA
jgi:hypothetical protein